MAKEENAEGIYMITSDNNPYVHSFNINFDNPFAKTDIHKTMNILTRFNCKQDPNALIGFGTPIVEQPSISFPFNYENQMDALEIAINDFKQRFIRYKEKVESFLNRYVDKKIENLTEAIKDESDKLAELQKYIKNDDSYER